ncbi:SDR family oxidoreductase [Clostridium bowmanii]|uniref:SDR family oxidoreductase n=1 Tax=Clostridium bowmanii TaxID=132925 RepID=UPI001C0CB2DE|nr:SDR family oxidoreductase [Clostridium bowmanii]MBU3188228.1 SDR family oxidoreductase [Clostridium bowmanii]MCA1072614.1 SDR family oxidoreductase [Clostridium bowmanii]
MKILVTGASGNVGSYVVKELLKMGEDVVAAGTDIKKLQKIFGDKIKFAEFDFTRPETFEKALDSVDRIFLMRPPHLGKPEDLYPFIETAKKHSIKLLSFLSLMGIEKNKIPPHHKIEKYIEELGIPFAHIRPGFFMQNVSGIHSEEIKEKDKIFIPAGKSKTSFIDVADIGLAIATVLHEPEKYKNTEHTITGPEALDYYQVAEILSNLTGRKIAYARPGFLKYRNYYIKKRGFDKGYVNITVALYFMTRMGTAKAITNEFFNLTGKQPKTFEEFAKENISAFIK